MLSHERSHFVSLINNTKLYPDVSLLLYMVIIIMMMMMMMMMMKLIIIVDVVVGFFHSLW